MVSGNVIGILVWARCLNLPSDQAVAAKGAVAHSSEHVAALLEKFFPAYVSVQEAVAHIERAGYRMEFNPQVLTQMTSGNLFAHPQFVARLQKKLQVTVSEESKDNSKRGPKKNNTLKVPATSDASASQQPSTSPAATASRLKPKHE